MNGKPVIRHGTEFDMNARGPEGTPNTKGKLVYAKGNKTESWNGWMDIFVPVIGSSPECGRRAQRRGLSQSQARAKEAFAPLEQDVKAGAAFGEGFVGELIDDAKDTVVIGGGIVQSAFDSQYGQHFEGVPEHPLIPSTARFLRRAEQAKIGWDHLSFGVFWRSQTADIGQLWGEGQYTKAIGKVAGRIFTMLPSPKSFAKVGGKLTVDMAEIGAKAAEEVVEKGVQTFEQANKEAAEKAKAKDKGVVINKR